MLLKSFKSAIFAVVLSSASQGAYASEITVSAASSLSDAFKDIAASFQKKHPETKILFNHAASGVLLQQLAKGAPVDVVAFADLETMDSAQSQNLVNASDRKIFATNSLVVIAPKNSTAALSNLEDLANAPFKRIAIGNPDSVPAGRYAKIALQAVSIWEKIAPKMIQTQNVRQSLDYVARSEVDAGIVYATDAAVLKEKVRVALDLTGVKAVAIMYPIAVTATSRRAAESKAFMDFVVSEDGQVILNRFGFKKP